jgi:Photosynthesis system II assembly factor YCF48
MSMSLFSRRSLSTLKSAVILACALVTATANAQWQILDSHVTADLKGIDALSNDVAWASGANGVVLRTEDGRTWQTCTVPSDAANLDFTSIQGFDTKTAVVMSGGKGRLSRVYKTTDGCRTWKKVFDNPNGSGSFESLHRATAVEMVLLGDPVDGKLSLYSSRDGGSTWSALNEPGLEVPRKAGGIVAGTASVTNVDWLMTFGTAGQDAAVYTFTVLCKTSPCSFSWVGKPTPVGRSSPTAGVASVAGRTYAGAPIPGVTGDVATSLTTTLVAVGGDPGNPDANTAVAAMSTDSGNTWRLSGMQPGGYRSAVAFDPKRQRFIAVGPNGTDVSSDDAVAWLPLRPGPHDAADADKHWTSISLPYVVGTKGRIGVLDGALSPRSAVR